MKGSQIKFNEQTLKMIQVRLDILRKGIVSEESRVKYYKNLLKKASEYSEVNIEICRMYTDLMEEEKQHVERFRKLILEW